MKLCEPCAVTLFDGAIECGICNNSDLKQLTIQKPEPKKQEYHYDEELFNDTPQRKTVIGSSVQDLGDGTYIVKSKTNRQKEYFIDLRNLRDHKRDCLGYRYGKICNHLKELAKHGVKIQ